MWCNNSHMSTDAKAKRGPPFKPVEELRVHRSFRLKPRHWAKIDMATKAEFEALLDAWEPKTTKPAK